MFENKEQFQAAFKRRLETWFGKRFEDSTLQEQYHTLGYMIREHVSGDWIANNEKIRSGGKKQLYYLSIEFLIGRLLGSNLLNLGIREVVDKGLRDLGISLPEVEEFEDDAGLGNGGLGRLAACFLDSLASLDYPGHGSCIRYRHGLFEQRIVNGYQVEYPDQWLLHGYVWEVRRPDESVEVNFWGEVKTEEIDGRLGFRHVNAETVLAVPSDIPVVGYGTETVNTLRLWNAEPNPRQSVFRTNLMDYRRATDSITEFLYPDDTHDEGKILRLKQQYFLVSASLHSIIRTYLKQHRGIRQLHEHVAIHINDTHPVLAIPELMRLLLDEHGLGWDEAWEITTKTMSYTNHTTLSEALEKWPIRLFQPLLPRIFLIVQEINERFCRALWERYPGDWQRIEHMAIVAHDVVKMAHLAIAGTYSVNGVAPLHTEILKNREMNLFYQYEPHKFNNKTNGITHRRWLMKANPRLAETITELIGDGWKRDPDQLQQLQAYVDDAGLQDRAYTIKQMQKRKLADFIQRRYDIAVDENSVFDVQIKRLHGYKRQLLNVLHIISLYNHLKEHPNSCLDVPRTFIFGAKASPGYYVAKKVIKLINAVAERVNGDPRTRDMLKVIFIENYNVSLAELIIPAANVSEQISTASKEASGTGNMKFMLNGALTIGTMDGANVDIFERVGYDNFFLFGLRSEEVLSYYQNGGYNAWEYYHNSPVLQQIMNQITNGSFGGTAYEYGPIYDSLLTENDPYFVLRDFQAYKEAQERVAMCYSNRPVWQRMSLVNIANAGYFSSDRTIEEYVKDIWHLEKL
ncbi:glycogen/starch/alpha-glucan phosphorylase [Ectobacillus ponti]|uniref:Alpha-1,4 glucan phosphorylase n=1 Tax=Ectobacillus ponti TaxID=2961894 RepID=A0AA41X3Y7_9BACI|nr:glycogen/starch/alpha-glucan phosphorylase [Ectobacillus ponti]MCP8968267.1 glycogen/starch/alpha-glucan phosphorylase [Ectobacillus ponti]